MWRLERLHCVSKEFCIGDPDFCVWEDCHSGRAAGTRNKDPTYLAWEEATSVPAPPLNVHVFLKSTTRKQLNWLKESS